MTSTTDELTPDYLERLARVQPTDLPDDLDLFYEDTATRGIRLNKAAYSLKHPEQRELFARDEEAWMDQFGLTGDERRLIGDRDWIELWRRGMSIYTMIKLIGVTGTPLVEIGKQMREHGTREMTAHGGQGARDFPPIAGHPDLAWHILRSLIADEFDVTVCQEMEVDHGVISPLPLIDFSAGDGWQVPIIPFVSNVILHPLPLPRRFYKLGQALRRAILSYPEDIGVVVVGTGGLSHQLTGTSFGTIHEDWDREFLRLVAEEPERLCDYTHEELMKPGGTEGVEV